MSYRVRPHQGNDDYDARGRYEQPQPFGHRGSPPAGSRQQRDYTLRHAGRQLRLGPIGFWSVVSLLVAMALWSAGTATYFAFRDDLLTRLIARQADMQYAYEDRIAELRAQIDRITSRQLLDQEQVEQRIEQLAKRQSTLESRATTLSGMPDAVPTGSIRSRPAQRTERNAPTSAKPSPINDPVIMAPALEDDSSRQSRVAIPRFQVAADAKPHGIAETLARVEESLDRIETYQAAALLAAEDRYGARAQRMRSVLSDLGLDMKKDAHSALPGAVGGPFVPVNARLQNGAFERQLHRVQLARAQVERLSRALTTVPVRAPLTGEIDTSSGFGVRLDPFLRAPAMHSGLDFRAPGGEPVRATAAGTIVSTGWNGGYGRMVEIDHGNGFSTRYAHLSEILVKEDQTVRPGQIIGRVGSTGRSTGPHLHYETRIDSEAVDPHKFLRAGLRLGEKL